eukprot:2372621-Pyramimonas_sp.AAC.1
MAPHGARHGPAVPTRTQQKHAEGATGLALRESLKSKQKTHHNQKVSDLREITCLCSFIFEIWHHANYGGAKKGVGVGKK